MTGRDPQYKRPRPTALLRPTVQTAETHSITGTHSTNGRDPQYKFWYRVWKELGSDFCFCQSTRKKKIGRGLHPFAMHTFWAAGLSCGARKARTGTPARPPPRSPYGPRPPWRTRCVYRTLCASESRFRHWRRAGRAGQQKGQR